MTKKEAFMTRCLALARKGINKTSPNPMVGAVLVYQDKIISEGWHHEYGQPHAEVDCLNAVPKELESIIPKSTLYVNLEPCSHFGKTPPCCDLIIRKRIPKVIVGCLDTNASVAGKGIKKMKAAGMTVLTGILEEQCRSLNRRFFTVQEKKRPFIILKWAESADGFIAGERNLFLQISDWPEIRVVHKKRYAEDAFLVGYQTALSDNPKLSNRFWKAGKQPTRVVIDFDNTLPAEIHLKNKQQKTIIFNFEKEAQEGSLIWKQLNNKQNFITQIIQQLAGLNSIVVEGGGKTLNAFIKTGVWDEIHRWVNTKKCLGKGVKAPRIEEADSVSQFMYGQDILYLYRPPA